MEYFMHSIIIYLSAYAFTVGAWRLRTSASSTPRNPVTSPRSTRGEGSRRHLLGTYPRCFPTDICAHTYRSRAPSQLGGREREDGAAGAPELAAIPAGSARRKSFISGESLGDGSSTSNYALTYSRGASPTPRPRTAGPKVDASVVCEVVMEMC